MFGGSPSTKAPDGGALMAGGWIPSSRYDDEWILIRGGQLYVTRGEELRKVERERRGCGRYDLSYTGPV